MGEGFGFPAGMVTDICRNFSDRRLTNRVPDVSSLEDLVAGVCVLSIEMWKEKVYFDFGQIDTGRYWVERFDGDTMERVDDVQDEDEEQGEQVEGEVRVVTLMVAPMLQSSGTGSGRNYHINRAIVKAQVRTSVLRGDDKTTLEALEEVKRKVRAVFPLV